MDMTINDLVHVKYILGHPEGQFLDYESLVWILAGIRKTTQTADEAMAALQDMDLSTREAVREAVSFAKSVGANYAWFDGQLNNKGSDRPVIEYFRMPDLDTKATAKVPGRKLTLQRASYPVQYTFRLFALDGRRAFEVPFNTVAGANGMSGYESDVEPGDHLLLWFNKEGAVVRIEVLTLVRNTLSSFMVEVLDYPLGSVINYVAGIVNVPDHVLTRLHQFELVGATS